MYLLKDQHNLNFRYDGSLGILEITRIPEYMNSLNCINIVKLIVTACFVGLNIC